VPIQLPQPGSVGWPFPMLKYKYYFSNKMYGSNLYPRDAMLTRVLAIALYPSVGVCVCLSVCLSVTSRCSVEVVDGSSWVLAWGLLSTSPTLCFKEIQVSAK